MRFSFSFAAFKLSRRAPLHNISAHSRHTKVARTVVSSNLINEEFSQLEETFRPRKRFFADPSVSPKNHFWRRGNYSAALFEGRKHCTQTSKLDIFKKVFKFSKTMPGFDASAWSSLTYQTKNLYPDCLSVGQRSQANLRAARQMLLFKLGSVPTCISQMDLHCSTHFSLPISCLCSTTPSPALCLWDQAVWSPF